MREAVIIEAFRTPTGRREGGLKDWRADELAALVIRELLNRTGVSPQAVDEVIVGCVAQVGEQTWNLGRRAALMAGLPQEVSAVTIDYACASSLKAVLQGAAAIASGQADVVIAAGAESMSRIPIRGSTHVYGDPIGPAYQEKYDWLSEGLAADAIADKWGFTRADLDQFSYQSHLKAANAIATGRFETQIVAVPPKEGGAVVTVDEGVRREPNLEKMAKLAPAFRPDGKVTPASSSQIADGAAAVLLMEKEKAKALGLRPKARIRALASVGSDPTLMLTGPIPASRKVLAKAGMSIKDMDLVEINEAFAPVVLAWQAELRADMDRVNVNGGAIALGHPLGATGARITSTMLHELERRNAQLGLISICCMFGLAPAVILDRDV